MMRENRAWMFKEVDSPLLSWEVYAKKEKFFKRGGNRTHDWRLEAATMEKDRNRDSVRHGDALFGIGYFPCETRLTSAPPRSGLSPIMAR